MPLDRTLSVHYKPPVKRKNKGEEKIQIAFCQYVKSQYPNVIFNCDLASGMKLTKSMAARAKKMRSSRGMCDFFAAQPSGQYKGFFLELKTGRDEVYTKKGEFKAKKMQVKNSSGLVIETYDHLQVQEAMMKRLRLLGYYAEFGLGFDDCQQKFDNYMRNN